MDVAGVTAEELPYQLVIQYRDGKEKLIPGNFREPDDLHYWFDYFVDMKAYDMLESVVRQLGLSAGGQLQVLFALLNMNIPNGAREYVVQAAVVDRRTDELVVSAKNQLA